MQSIVNFRDVGQSLQAIDPQCTFPTHILYRGGRPLPLIPDNQTAQLNNMAHIITLRPQKIKHIHHIPISHVPIKDTPNIYDTTQRSVRKWLNAVIKALYLNPVPVYIHCTSGKDRTGVAIAAILLACDIPPDLIIKEYLLSQGQVDPRQIAMAIDGFANIHTYLNRLPSPLKHNLQPLP